MSPPDRALVNLDELGDIGGSVGGGWRVAGGGKIQYGKRVSVWITSMPCSPSPRWPDRCRAPDGSSQDVVDQRAFSRPADSCDAGQGGYRDRASTCLRLWIAASTIRDPTRAAPADRDRPALRPAGGRGRGTGS